MIDRLVRTMYALPLRVHLLLMALLLSLPAVALIVHSGKTQHAEALRKGYSEARRLANAIAKEQYNATGNVEQLLMALEQIPEIERHDASATSGILAGLLKKNPQFANIIIADRDGQVWASGLPMTTRFSIRERRFFKEALRTRKFSSGEFRFGEVSGNPTVGFGYPIIDGTGALRGVISANLDFKDLKELLHGAAVPEYASYTIVDRNGTIVARNLNPERYVGTLLKKDSFARMQGGPDKDTFIAGDLTDDQRIVSYRRLKLDGEREPYLYVRTAFPLENVLEKARQALVVNIAMLSSILLAAILSVMYLGNVFFVKRIDKLQQAARRLAEGDLQVRVSEEVAGGELGHLGEVFDEMAARLAARQATLVRNERELYELNRDLSRRVEEETERRVNHERLLARHARLAAMGQMIGAIAHQWRQPLATLGATVQSIGMAWERGCLDRGFLKKAEADAKKQLYYMSDTIEDFRNFFTPEKLAESFDVKEKIVEVSALVSPQFAHSGVNLRTCDLAPGEPLLVVGYQNEFKQSLLNLVSNAFDATLEKSGREPGAQTGVEEAEVTITLSCSLEKVVVAVRDNGCGIAPEHADKVFDPYFTTKSGDKGTGIGLYMTRLIIEESMAGTIGFESSPAETVFRIELARAAWQEEVANG